MELSVVLSTGTRLVIAAVFLFQDSSADMVVACCRFLCYFCRTGRINQRAMFEHLSYLLSNSCMLLCENHRLFHVETVEEQAHLVWGLHQRIGCSFERL